MRVLEQPDLSNISKLEGALRHGKQVLIQGPGNKPLALETVSPPGDVGMQGAEEGQG